MGKTTWKWLEEGGVELAGVAYQPAPGATKAAVLAYGRDYAEKVMVFTILFKAKLAYETGAVDYQGARGRLPGLLREYGLAEQDLETVAAGIDQFFLPAGIHQTLVGDHQVFSAFLEEASGKLGVKGD